MCPYWTRTQLAAALLKIHCEDRAHPLRSCKEGALYRVAIILLAAAMLNRLRQLFSTPETAPRPLREFSVPEGVRVYAVGDIHGRSQLLAKTLAAIHDHARSNPAKKTYEIFLGDYIDRGMESKQVIDLLTAPAPDGHERICLLGNHEETLLRFLTDPKILRDWANFGGYATLASYGIGIPESMSPEQLFILRAGLQKNMPPAHLEFLRKLHLNYTVGDYLFVHAGILPNIPIAQQKREHLLWIREPFLSHTDFHDYYVVHGHSPVVHPDIHSHRANLDVSAAPTDSLCCLILEGSERHTLLITREND